MADQIISYEQIRQKARAAHRAGKSRDSHQMNWNSEARQTWLAEFDLCAEKSANSVPLLHAAPVELARIDLTQSCAAPALMPRNGGATC